MFAISHHGDHPIRDAMGVIAQSSRSEKQSLAVFDMKSEIISIETKYKGWARFSVVSVCLPNGQLVQREIEDHGAAVAVEKQPFSRNSSGLRRSFRRGRNIRSKPSPASRKMLTLSRPRGARRSKKPVFICTRSSASPPFGPCPAFQPSE